jgi:hypothetical protein
VHLHLRQFFDCAICNAIYFATIVLSNVNVIPVATDSDKTWQTPHYVAGLLEGPRFDLGRRYEGGTWLCHVAGTWLFTAYGAYPMAFHCNTVRIQLYQKTQQI